MAIVSDIEIRLRADIARLQQDLNGARRSVDTAMSGISTTVKRAMGLLAGFGIGLGVGALVKDVIDAQREFDKLNASLVTATGSTANAAEAFKALQSFAATTPFDLAQATKAFLQLRNLGLEPSERALTSFGNTAASKSIQLSQVVDAVADAATGQFERLKDAFGITAKLLGDNVALTFQGTTTMVKNSAKDIQDYLVKIGEVQFGGAMARQAATLDGAISNLGDTWKGVLRSFSTGGFGEGVQGAVLALSNALSDLGTIMDALGGKATAEGGKVKEIAPIHDALTATFRTLAIAGVGVSGAFHDISIQLAFLKEAGQAKDLAGLKDAFTNADKALEENDKLMKERIARIQGAVQAQEVADAAEAKSLAASGKAVPERLAKYAVVLTAQEKQNQARLAIVDIEEKITGVTQQSAADLTKIKTALDTGAITQEHYNLLKSKMIEANYQASLSGKEEIKSIERSTAAIKARGDQQALLNERNLAQIAFLHDIGQLNDTDYITKAGEAEVKSLQDQKAEQQALLALAYKKHQNQVEQITLTGTVAALQNKIDSQQIKNAQDLEKEEHRLYTLAANNTADLIEAARAEAKTQQDKTRDMQDEVDALGLTAKQIAEVTAARLRDRAAALDRQAEISIIEDVTEALHAQADELRKQADLGITRQKVEEQQKFWGDVEQTAHDAFISIGDTSKSTWERLRDSAKSIFFEWLYQMTLKKWVINIGASVDGSAAVAGIAGASSSGSSSLTSATSALSSIYTAATGGGLGTGFLGSLTGGLNGAGAGSGLTSSLGLSIGNTIADTVGPQLAGALSTGLTGLATALPWAAAAVGIYSLAKAAFGMGDKQYADSSTLSGTLNNSSFAGNVATAYTQKGGWFRSDKSGVDTTAVNAALATTLGATYKTITDASASYAKVLGLNADSIATRTQSLSIALGSDDAANQTAIANFFSGVSDTIAQELVPSIAQFTVTGETASTTLQRLVVDFQAVDVLMASIGVTSKKAFGDTSLGAIAAREDLIALAGGLTTLSTQMQFISDNFITQASKAAVANNTVTSTMAAISGSLAMFGYGAIKTTDQYTAVVMDLASSGALATDTGRQLYETLLALAPAFKTTTDYAAAAKASANDVAGNSLDALSKAVEAQKTVVTNAYNAAMDALDARVTDLTDGISRMTALSTVLKGAIMGVDAPGSAEGSRAAASAQIAAALAIAKASGVLPSQDSLTDALNTLKATSSDQFATLTDYQRSVAQSNAALESLGGLTDTQVSAAQQQINLLQAQKDDLTAANTAQLARLDSLVTAAQSQINAVNGINDSVLTIGQALLAVYNATSVLSGFSGISNTAVAPTNVSTGNAFDQAAVLEELRVLNARINQMAASADATAKASSQFASQFNTASAGGGPLMTVPA